jgi:hypothetical protein
MACLGASASGEMRVFLQGSPSNRCTLGEIRRRPQGRGGFARASAGRRLQLSHPLGAAAQWAPPISFVVNAVRFLMHHQGTEAHDIGDQECERPSPSSGLRSEVGAHRLPSQRSSLQRTWKVQGIRRPLTSTAPSGIIPRFFLWVRMSAAPTMSSRLDPPPILPPTPPPWPPTPRATSRMMSVVIVIGLLATAAAVAWWLVTRDSAGEAGRVSDTVTLHPDFGGSVSAAQIERLLQVAGGSDLNNLNLGLAVGQGQGRPVYGVGDELRVGFVAERDARCTLLHRDAAGTFSTFFPETGKATLLEGGERWVSEGLRVGEPLGRESFLLVCVDTRQGHVDLNTILQRPERDWGKTISAARADYVVER